MKITWFVNQFGDVEVYTGAFTEQDLKDSNYDVYLHNSREVKDFFQSIGVSEHKNGDIGQTNVPKGSSIESEIKKLTHTCPKCKRASHWGDWDYATEDEIGKHFPSLGYESNPTQEYCCPKCKEWSTQSDIEEMSNTKEENKTEEQQIQETLNAIFATLKKSNKGTKDVSWKRNSQNINKKKK